MHRGFYKPGATALLVLPEGWKMWKDLSRFTLGRRFFRGYVIMILVPLAALGIFLLFLIGYVQTHTFLLQQEAWLQSIREVWDTPEEQAHSVQYALGSNAELAWCLEEGYYSKAEQLYSYKKSLFTFFSNIMLVNHDVESIVIYSDNPDILLAWPFDTADHISLPEEEAKALHALKGNDILWHMEAAEEKTDMPEIYAYYRIYSDDYREPRGFVRLKIKTDFLEEYVELLKSSGQSVSFLLYRGEELIYEQTAFALPEGIKEEGMDQSSGNVFNDYYFQFSEPSMGLRLLILIRNDNLLFGYGTPLVVCCCLVVCCLYILSRFFFRDVSGLSRRIGDFARYMQEFDDRKGEVFEENPLYLSGRKKFEKDEFSVLVASFNALIARNAVLNRELLDLELRNKDARLAAMQAQIHPHFIYGTLETIRMLALQNDDEEVEAIVCSFSKLMRYSLNHPSESSTLSRELEMNQYYMDIQLLRYDGRLTFEKEMEAGMEDIYCPPFVIQPLLENALVHGVSVSLDPCRVRLRIFREDGAYVICVEDDGNPITDERMGEVNERLAVHGEASGRGGEENGFALQNVSERLWLFYHGQASLILCRAEEWTRAEIRIGEEEWRGQICSGC